MTESIKKTIIDPLKITDKRINLSKDGKAWIEIETLPEELKKYGLENFEMMFSYCPSEKGRLIIGGEEKESQRYHRSYMNTPKYNPDNKKNFMFSGRDESENNNELPECFDVFFRYMQEKDRSYNQVVANWYPTSLDHIPYHVDCEVGMIENAQVATLTLNKEDDADPEKCRILCIKPKVRYWNDRLHDRLEIILRHGSIVLMGGETQKKFFHAIPKVYKDTPVPRISLSFRQFEITN